MKRAPLNPERKRLIVVGPNNKVREFDTAQDVSIFMWRRNGKEWTVYACLEPLSFSATEMQAQMEQALKLLDNLEAE